VAKINPVKLKQDADKEEKAGRLEKSILLLRQIVDDNPKDWNTVNKIGDLYARLGRNKDAAGEYAKVASFYAEDGFLLKSIAIWKKINKLDTTALEPYANLADLYSKQGLLMEAKSQYQIVVDEYIKRGKMREAGDVLKKMADIDPADLKIRSKLADLYTREGNSSKAVDEHVAIAEELNKKGHLAEALQVLEKGLKLDPRSNRLRAELARIHLVQKNYDKAAAFLEEAVQLSPNDPQILSKLGEAYVGSKKLEEAEAVYKQVLELDPKDDESRAQMARVFLLQGAFDRSYEELVPLVERLMERREGDRAVAMLQQIVQRNPSHIKSLLKLTDLYGLQKKDNAVTQTYSQLTEAYINQGQLEQAVAVLEMLVAREPSNGQYKTKLDFVRGKLASSPRSAGASSPAAPAAQMVTEEDEEFDLSVPSEPAAFEPQARPLDTAPAPAPRPRAAAATPLKPAAAAKPVIEPSGPLGDEDKEFIEEHLAEGKVFRKYGLIDKAADQFEAVVARYPDNVESRTELREVYKEKSQLDKAAEQCLALAEIARLRGDPGLAAQHEEEAQRLAPHLAVAAAAPAEAEVEEEVSISVDEPEEDISLEVEEEAAEEDISLDVEDEPPAEEPVVAVEEPSFISDDEIEAPVPAPAEEEFDLSPEEEFPLEETAAAPAPEEPSLSFDEEPEPAPAAPQFEPEPAFEDLPPPPVAPRAGSGVPHELQKVLDEVESYVALGFVDDARDALREIESRYPDHPAIKAKSEELGLDQEPSPPPPPVVSPEEPELSLDDMSLDAGPEPSAEFDLDEPSAPEEPSSLDEQLGLEEPVPEPAPEPEPEPEPQAVYAAPSAPASLDLDLPDEPAAAPEPMFAEEPPAPEPADDGGLDLGAELGDLFSTQSAVEEAAPEQASTDLGDAGLSEIFKEFKKGVDRQLSKEDYDTRYNLGIAYKEMGLIDEAIAEFQLAAKDEARILECSSMLGICFMEKGMPKLAVKWFEKGLASPGRSEDEYVALRYDLAMAHEAAGETDRALGLYTELYGQDANFRDVASKVRELRAARG
jgi:pilus assembly protein FimV